MHKVYLKPGKEDSLKRFHPWIFSGAIARFDGEPDEGEVVEVYTSKKEFIAEGHFQIGSIAVRVLSFRQEPIDHDFWKRKLEIAYDMRRSIGIATNPTNNTYRLVHGEGDNLPGLVIDVYAKTAVMQAHSAGMHVDRMTIAEALSEVMGDKIENIYYKSETTLPFKAVPCRLAERSKDRILCRPARKSFFTGTLCQRPFGTEYVLLYRRILILCHARRCKARPLCRQLCQSN